MPVFIFSFRRDYLHQFRRFSREFSKKLKNAQNSYIQNLSSEEYTLWKATKKFERLTPSNTPIRTANGWTRSDQGKADAFTEHLCKVFEPEGSSGSTNYIDEFLDSPCQMSLPIKPFRMKEIGREIRTRTQQKTGYDLITAEILNKMPKRELSSSQQFEGFSNKRCYSDLKKMPLFNINDRMFIPS